MSGNAQAAHTRPSAREVARNAGLHHVSDEEPGITRVRRGRGFSYHDRRGRLITDSATKKRIRSLAIPPAWEQVWICPEPLGHIQATGRDDEGRKQYRYHPDWREARNEHKFHRMQAFGAALPRIRRRIRKDLRQPGMSRNKVLAVLIRLLDLTGIRIGSEAARRRNNSFGLTTLRRRHVAFEDRGVKFHFRGKGGQPHEVSLSDPLLAGILHDCYAIPGHEMFQYLDEEGERHSLTPADVNQHLREISGGDFTAKDFRTWVASIQALLALEALPAAETDAARRRNLNEMLDLVSGALRNTRTVCRDFYVHPILVEGYRDGRIQRLLQDLEIPGIRELRRAERRFLALLAALGEEQGVQAV
jgi:DNA topoisomerase I